MVIMRILIYDRYPMLSAFIRKLIEEEMPESKVFIGACPVEDKLQADRFDVVVLAVSKEDTIIVNLNLIKEISVIYPGSKLLIFDISNPNHRETSLYIREGVWGYISLSGSADSLKICLERLDEGKKFIPYEAVEWILDNHRDMFTINVKTGVKYKALTSSELRVARELIRGRKVSDIARDSDRKVSTISTLKRKAMEKVGVKNVIELKNIMESMGET